MSETDKPEDSQSEIQVRIAARIQELITEDAGKYPQFFMDIEPYLFTSEEMENWNKISPFDHIQIAMPRVAFDYLFFSNMQLADSIAALNNALIQLSRNDFVEADAQLNKSARLLSIHYSNFRKFFGGIMAGASKLNPDAGTEGG